MEIIIKTVSMKQRKLIELMIGVSQVNKLYTKYLNMLELISFQV